MKRTITILLLILVSSTVYSQSDSTDLNLYTTPPVLVTEMDSMMFNQNDFQDYFLEFTISDTSDFGSVSIELVSSQNQLIYKHVFSLAELQEENLIDANWLVTIEFGILPVFQGYSVSLIIGDYIGALDPKISKNY